MRKYLSIFGIVTLLLFLLSACFKATSPEDTWICNSGTGMWEKYGNPDTPAPTEKCKKTDLEKALETKPSETNSDKTAMEEANIVVTAPTQNQLITSPFTLSGKARVFESQFNYKLKDSTGLELAKGSLSATSPDMGQYGNFESEILFATPKSETGTLEVFDYSAKDGLEINKVTIQVKFTKIEYTTVKVFFNNDKLDPEITCTKVFPIERKIVKNPAVGYNSLTELLKGPTTEEKALGYYTNINAGVTLNTVKIVNGVVTADFDQKLQEKVGGSCRTGAIISQITETLKQFPTVKDVIISVEGETETILQP